MTYCLGLLLEKGLVLASDSRTNAGVDAIATVCKMTIFEQPGRSVAVLLAAGNLSLTQSAVSVIEEWAEGDDDALNIKKARSLYRVARIVGAALREVYKVDNEHLANHGTDFNATFILGGQIKGERPRLFHIYSPGNFIEATQDTPFFQIGETKYGRPVFDRLLQFDMPLSEAAKLALISFDSTMRSNLSVALPIDMAVYETDKLELGYQHRFGADDSYMQHVRRYWGGGLRKIFDELDPPSLSTKSPAPRKRAKPLK